MDIKALLTMADAGRLLGLSERRLRRLVKIGAVPHIMLPGGEVRFDVVDLGSWIRGHKRAIDTPSELSREDAQCS